MTTKPFKPLVLVQHRTTGRLVMYSRRFWDSRDDKKYEKNHVVAHGDTPEEVAKLRKVKDQINNLFKDLPDA